MVKKGESLTPEHKAAIGRGIKSNRAARDEMARRANEMSLVQRLKQQEPCVLHAHRADEQCNQDCTTSGRGGTSPCECRVGHQCIWCQYQKGKEAYANEGWYQLRVNLKLAPGVHLTTEQVVKALASLGVTTVDGIHLGRDIF